jgi:hypothetical protein
MSGVGLMASIIAGLTVLTVLGFNGCTEAAQFDGAAHLAPSPSLTVRVSEPGVLPEGTALLVRTNDTVNASRAFRGTVYDASIANEVLDQNGNVLIPKESPVELVVRSVSYLGPGGVGTSELTLRVQTITVNGVRYSVETVSGQPHAGGLEDAGGPSLVGGGESRGRVIIRGRHINVPTGTELAFRLEDPIRLKGYRR